MQHISEMAESMKKAANGFQRKEHDGIGISGWVRLIDAELKDVRTLDFTPDSRYKFVLIRQKFQSLSGSAVTSSSSKHGYLKMAEGLIQVMKSYTLEGVNVIPYSFDFVTDGNLKSIIQRDYRELQI